MPQTKFWAHPMFAMALGLGFITLKNLFGHKFMEWYMPAKESSTKETPFIEVHITAPSSVSESLATGLVEDGLAACVQVRTEHPLTRYSA